MFRARVSLLYVLLGLAGLAWGQASTPAAPDDALDTSGLLDSSGVKIHYVTRGTGPLLVLLHGFPDFWYTWRAQIPELSKRYQVVALDLRGYNESDKPEGVEAYRMETLVGDVAATLAHFHAEKAVIVGHDWGGAIAWSFAMRHPERTEKLIVLNLPHPRGLHRELLSNPEQQKNSQYARDFQQPDAARKLTAEGLAFWVKDEKARPRYLEAFRKSSFEGMLSYYKANYPRLPASGEPAPASPEYPPVKCPTLVIHGLKDTALLPGALNDTWKWVEAELTIHTIPGAGHFVQQDAAERVTAVMTRWLAD